MKSSLPPTRWLVIAAVMAVLLIYTTYHIATDQPWLGIEFKPALKESGLVVVRVDPQSPNRGQLLPGDVVVGLSSSKHTEYFDAALPPISDFLIPTFAIMNRYLAQHKALWNILHAGDIAFIMVDGSHRQGYVVKHRPGRDLPLRFWTLAASGVIAFLIGVGIWAYRPQLPVAPVVIVGSTGTLIFVLLASLFVSRELTLSPLLLHFTIAELNPGSEVAVYAFVALLWYYPTPRSRFPVGSLLSMFVVLIWINETLQLVDLPYNTYALQYIFAGVLIFGLAVFQWRQTRYEAVQRAALQWYLLSFLIVYGIALIMTFIPNVFFNYSFAPKYYSFYLLMFLYLGLAFGIARYRLFDLERWWLEVWLWLGGGVLVIAMDILLVSIFDLTHLLALGFSLILAGWVYLPLRQWLFRRILRSARTRLDDHFPLLVETLFNSKKDDSFASRWRALVKQVFSPMVLTTKSYSTRQTALAESGLVLQIPAFDGEETFELRYRDQGRRLYGPREVALADMLLSLTRRTAELWQEREEGVRVERHRIMHALHDEVAERLLSLMHRVQEPTLQTQAKEAMTTLRQIIYALDDKEPITLNDLLNELEASVREQLRDTGAALEWREPEGLPDTSLSARERINLTRVIQEATVNAIKHGGATRLMIELWQQDTTLHLRLCNDGDIRPLDSWKAGKGLHNIHARMNEIGGVASWTVEMAGLSGSLLCCLELCLPLPGPR